MWNGKIIRAYGAEKNIRLQQRGENVNFVVISADENIICFIRQHHGHQRNAYCGKVFEMVNSKQKFCSHECYIKNRFWSREDAEQFVDALMNGEKINIPQWLRDKLKDQL